MKVEVKLVNEKLAHARGGEVMTKAWASTAGHHIHTLSGLSPEGVFYFTANLVKKQCGCKWQKPQQIQIWLQTL